jgi:hypothetical protein
MAAGENQVGTSQIQTSIQESAVEFTPQVAQVLGLFAPQIDRLIDNVGQALELEASAKDAFEVANEAALRAKDKQTSKMHELRQAENMTYSSRNWLAEQQQAALSALTSTSGRPDETLIAQTIIEGGQASEATSALETFAELARRDEGELVYKRLVILGSFPVRRSVRGEEVMQEEVEEENLSVVDVSSDHPEPLSVQRLGGRHFVTIKKPERVSQFILADAVLGGTIDTSGQERIVQTEPLDLKVVTSEEQFRDLTGEETFKQRFARRRHSDINVGTKVGDLLPPVIITGEAVDHFSSWLSESKLMRPMLFAALLDENGDAEHVPPLEEGSTEQGKAVMVFNNSIEHYVENLVGRERHRPSIPETIQTMRTSLLFSRAVQEYLGINDAYLGERIGEVLGQYVKVWGADVGDRGGPVEVHATDAWMNFGSVEELCEHVENSFKEGGFDLSATSVFKNIAKNIQLDALIKESHRQPDDRAGRKRSQRIAETIESISVRYAKES